MIVIDKSVLDDIEELREFLSDWEVYVGPYFAEKHRLKEDIDRADEIVNKYKKILDNQDDWRISNEI